MTIRTTISAVALALLLSSAGGLATASAASAQTEPVQCSNVSSTSEACAWPINEGRGFAVEVPANSWVNLNVVMERTNPTGYESEGEISEENHNSGSVVEIQDIYVPEESFNDGWRITEVTVLDVHQLSA
jgi:hypothetical protein